MADPRPLTGQKLFNDTFGREGRQWSSLSDPERKHYDELVAIYMAIVEHWKIRAERAEDRVRELQGILNGYAASERYRS